MNRKARRSIASTPEALAESIKAQLIATQKLTINQSVKGMLAITAITLHDQYGWEVDKISELFDKLDSQFQCVIADTVKLDELVGLARELGIVFK